MKIKELQKNYKYDRDAGAFILDVQLEDYRDAYSNWDFSPFSNRDLDESLSEYLIECSFEIPLKYDLAINFHVRGPIYDGSRERKSIIGIHNYFKYQIKRINGYRLRLIRDVFTFLVFGCILLLSGFYANRFMGDSVMASVLVEGLNIGGWVMLWEMFSAWFFDLKKASYRIKHFRRLDESKIFYTYDNMIKT